MSLQGDSLNQERNDHDWTVLRMLEWGTDYFATKGIDSPRLSVEWLLSELMSIGRLDLYLQYDRPLTSMELDTMREWVRRRARHEPLQYITGFVDFYHCRIKVAPAVLIPRPETEYLVELILADYSHDHKRVLDIGTGSGCIALALKKERPQWDIVAMDVSEQALKIAKENAALNNLDIDWIHLDVAKARKAFQGLHFDIIVSNPPYILPSEADSIDPQVKNFEPSIALFHEQPESLYEEIVLLSEQMQPAADVYAEIHCDYGHILLQHLKKEGRELSIKQDLYAKDRYLVVKKKT